MTGYLVSYGPADKARRAADARDQAERGLVQRRAGNGHRREGGERQGLRGVGLGARDREVDCRTADTAHHSYSRSRWQRRMDRRRRCEVTEERSQRRLSSCG